MSLPGNALSPVAVPSSLLHPDTLGRPSLLMDYELGGIGLQDPSQGLQVQPWRFRVDGSQIKVGPHPYTTESTLLTAVGVTAVSGSFDQNMNPMVAYVLSATARLYWYDSVPASYVTVLLGADVKSPMLTLDDKRPEAGSQNRSDVLLFYVRGSRLCYRQQRDRFQVERTLQWLDGNAATIRKAGMSQGLRVQLEVVGLDAGLAVGAVLGASAEAVYQPAVTSISLAMPTGLETGDLLHAVLMHRSAATPPVGWMLVTSQACAAGAITQTMSVFKKTTTAPADSGVSAAFAQSASDRMGLAYFAVRGTPGTTPTYIGAAISSVNDLATNTVTAPAATAAAPELAVTLATSINSTEAVSQPGVAAGMDLFTGLSIQCRLGGAVQRRRAGQSSAGRFTFDNGTPANNGLAAITLRFGHT